MSWWSTHGRSCTCFLHVLILVGLVSSAGAEIEWVIETPDGPRQFEYRSDRSLAVDPLGQPHIAYGEDGLYYGWSDGANWHIEVVDSTPDVGMFAAIALDRNGRPHMSYADTEANDLRYARRDPAGWCIEVAADSGGVGWCTSIAIDTQLRPHISHFDYINHVLKYTFKDMSGWHIELPDTASESGIASSISLDGQGFPHISYFAYDLAQLKYAFADEFGWHVVAIDTVDFADPYGDFWYTSLALGEEGEPNIGYGVFETDQVWFARRSGGSWSIELVDAGWSVSAAFAGPGLPVLAYCGGYTVDGALKLARREVSGWNFEIVDSDGYGWEPAVAADEAGNVHICYRGGAWELRYAREDQADWRIDVIDREGRVGTYTSIGLDEFGLPHISYYDYGAYDLKYSHRDASGWHWETVDSEGRVGWYTSLVLDSACLVHIGYQDVSDGSIKYARQTDGGWELQIVDDLIYHQPGLVSLAVDSWGFPHLTYYYCGEYGVRGIKYARMNEDGWSTELLEGSGRYSSIVVDDEGSPRICRRTEDGLEYMFWASSHWVHELVDPVVSGWPSLVLDIQGFPHVSYCDFVADAVMDSDLRYAFRDKTSWHVELVDSVGIVGHYTSLALDSRGFPHISYHDSYPNEDLKYAFQDESGWHVQTVAGNGDVGSYASLALDPNDIPFISYSDHSRDDLKMARGSEWTAADGTDRLLSCSPIRLTKIWPNPLRSRAFFRYTIGYDLPLLSILVYDLSGRAVVTLSDLPRMQGTYCAEWDLLDSRGEPVPAGPYVVMISGIHSDQKAVGRVIVLR